MTTELRRCGYRNCPVMVRLPARACLVHETTILALLKLLHDDR